jgi:uncharacterized membrane protein YphA (DoxX/SURF4 family)
VGRRLVVPAGAVTAVRVAVAVVWWYEGLWCKVLGAAPDQRAIIASLPGLPGGLVSAVLVGFGLLEILLGLWVLSGVRAHLAAYAQLLVLVAANGGGLLVAGERIVDPGLMLTQNAVLLAAAWLVARAGDE